MKNQATGAPELIEINKPKQSLKGLKIRVSVVRFRPWPPIKSKTYKLDR
jgi:hypothetical protein